MRYTVHNVKYNYVYVSNGALFLHSTLVLLFNIDIVLALSIHYFCLFDFI